MITRTRRGDVEIVTIDRHARRNALDVAHCHELAAAVRAGCCGGGARAIVITGAGTSFCAGADLGTVYGDGAAFDACWASEDLAEGMRARAERRPPRFRGR